VADIILEIHHINVGTGDASIIVVRDTAKMKDRLIANGKVVPANNYAMLKLAREVPVDLSNTVITSILIDSGNDSGKAAKIKAYLTGMGINELNYVLTSHFHQDHLGGYPCILKLVNKAVDAKAYDRSDGAPRGSSNFTNYRTAIAGYTLVKVPAVVGTPITTSIDLGTGNRGQQITLRCVATDAGVSDGTQVSGATNQNDFGMAWVLKYGQFVYLTGGDLGGFSSGNYVDMETPMIEKAGYGHVCACKINHHGSRESSNPYYLSKMTPKAAIISVGDKKYGSDYHPHPEVIDDLDAAQWDISSWLNHPAGTNIQPNSLNNYYATSLRKNLGDPRDKIGVVGKGKIGGDIVVIVDDTNIDTRSKYAVYCNGEKPGAGVVKNNSDLRDAASCLDYFDCH
jgi:hypothetical protein